MDFSADGRSSRTPEGQFSLDVLSSTRVWFTLGIAGLDGYCSLFPKDCSGTMMLAVAAEGREPAGFLLGAAPACRERGVGGDTQRSMAWQSFENRYHIVSIRSPGFYFLPAGFPPGL